MATDSAARASVVFTSLLNTKVWTTLCRIDLQTANTISIERSEWKPLELEALNQYVQTLPQYRIQSQLQMAMKNLSLYYHERSVSQNCQYSSVCCHNNMSLTKARLLYNSIDPFPGIRFYRAHTKLPPQRRKPRSSGAAFHSTWIRLHFG
jgi:hypothetical protein